MKILFLAHRIPFPPDKGEKIRAYHELKLLASHHIVDLFAFANGDEMRAGAEALGTICRRVHLVHLGRVGSLVRAGFGLLWGQSFSKSFFHSRTMRKAVQRALEEGSYDAIFVYSSAMAPYVLGKSSLPMFVDLVDSDASKWAQYSRFVRWPASFIYEREAKKLGEYEREIARFARYCIVSTPLEAEAIDPGGRWEIRCVPNGVSIPRGVSGSLDGNCESKGIGRYVVFVGQMDYYPNIDAVQYFAKSILPLVRRVEPDLRFVIVGRNPSPQVQKLGNLPGITVTGEVPDVEPFLRNSVVAIAPFRISQGIQNKILEALALNVPVVATSRPARAIGATEQHGLYVADTPEEFARILLYIIRNPSLRKRSMGEEFVRQHFNWEKNLEPLHQWLLGTAANHPDSRNYVAAG